MIYTARFEDVKTIIKMALNIPQEHGFENLPKVNLEKVCEYFYSKFEEAPIFVYKNPEGNIIGFVGAEITEMWWSTDPVVTDYVFYVDPEYRSPEVFETLIGALKDFAKLNKMPIISYFLAGKRLKAKEKLYEKNGFKNSGFITTYGM